MKKIKSYTGIWNVEKVLYAINDFNLPFPVTFTHVYPEECPHGEEKDFTADRFESSV